MQVIGAGLGRTGTMSLKVALQELGAGPCLHSLDALSSDGARVLVPDSQRFARVARIDWRQALAPFGSSVDWLGAGCYREMLGAWPDARVILTVRDPGTWYESCQATLHATTALLGDAGASDAIASVLEAVDRTIWQGIFAGRFSDREYALHVFERHRREVLSFVPADRLLIYDVSEGWEPLCELLEVPVPDTPFPHLNGRNAFWTRLGVSPAVAGAAVAAASAASAAGSEANRPERAGGTGRVGHTNGASGGLGAEASTGAADRRSVADNQLVPKIAGLTLAHPETSLTQAEVLALLGLEHDEFALGVFGRCGVERRRLHLDQALLATTLQGRTGAVEEQLMALAIEAVEALEVDMRQIGTIVSASLYSLGCPTISHRLIEHFEMDPSTDKYHVVGVGCASAVPLIRLLAPALNDGSGKKALIIAAESMSGLLCAATTEDPRSKTVGSAIFGDGCAAMLLDGAASAEGPRVLDSRVHQIPDTLDAVRIDATADDSYLALIRELPYVAGEHLRGLVDSFLTHNGLTAHMIDHWLIHPGGKRIIECAQEALSLSDDDVSVSYDVLANYGNVGTPSIFYVLHETAAQRHPRRGQQGLVVTIGPGVSVGMMLLRW